MLALLPHFLLFTVASSLSNYPIVQTSYGAVRGYEYQAENGFTAEIFKKIPYAAPPIGPRRWKKPEPPFAWTYTLDGTFFGPSCAQVPAPHQVFVTGTSEDCLTLNVFTSKYCRESNASCPVVFYIHGGGEIFGGITFAEEIPVKNFPTQGVIFITTNYRLSLFGVMALGDENALPANLAMHDVLESLRFVQREIHAFGGDKDQITVLGHSSAASMTLAFVFSPAVNTAEETIFGRAITISGTAAYESEERQVDKSHKIAKRLGCEGTATEIINCLWPLSTDEVVKAAYEVTGPDILSDSQLGGITVAGELMPIHNTKDIRENQPDHMSRLVQPTKLLIGTTLKEFDVMQDMLSKGRVQALDVLGVRNVEECMDKYFSDVESGSFVPGYDTTSQGLFLTTALFAEAQSRAGAEVYVYQYDYPAHATHADDAYYIVGLQEHPMDENERWLSRVYPLYFTNFIKGLPLASDWSQFDPALMSYYSVNKSFTDGVEPRMKLGYNRNLVDYYNKMMEYDEKLTLAKQQLLNEPVQMRNLNISSSEDLTDSESFNLRDLLFYFTVICIIVFIIYKLYNCYQDRRSRADESSYLIAR